MHLPLCTHTFKLESYIDRCKEIIDQSLDEYHKAWRTGFPRDKHLTRADYFAGRLQKAEERLEELKEKNRIAEPRKCATVEENSLAFK